VPRIRGVNLKRQKQRAALMPGSALPEGFDSDAVMDALHDRMESEKVNCRLCHEDIAGPPVGDGWD
jgi:hypothetical protein